MHVLPRIYTLCLVLQIALASPGDNLEEFDDCIYQCQQITCYNNPYYIMQEQFREALQKKNHHFHRYEPSWHFDWHLSGYLKALLWNCKSNCDYQCQRIITQERKAAGEEVLQFHGKWPFLRVLGMQEFASVLLSMANFVPHLLGFIMAGRAIKTLKPVEAQKGVEYPKGMEKALETLLRNIRMVAFITMCAWISSAVFHVRDFILTEKLDYYFAGMTVLSGFYSISYRYFKLFLPTRKWQARALGFACLVAYSAHIYRLETDWLYTYNMRANILVGVLQNIMWGLTCYSLYSKYLEEEQGEKAINVAHLNYIRPQHIILGSFYSRSAKLYSLYPLLLCGIVIVGMSLEIFDFAPFFFDLVDAHALWHLVTIFPAYLGWYDWMIWDVCENVWGDQVGFVTKKVE